MSDPLEEGSGSSMDVDGEVGIRRGRNEYVLEENMQVDSDVEGEDLIDDDNMMADYAANPELDRYDSELLASENEELSDLTPAQRRMAESEMRNHDQSKSTRRKVGEDGLLGNMQDVREPAGMQSSNLESDLLMSTSEFGNNNNTNQPGILSNENDQIEEDMINLEDFVPPLAEWVVREAPRREICRRFRRLLTDYNDQSGKSIYAQRISQMCSDNRESLIVSYLHLGQVCPTLGIWVADCPKLMLEILSEEARLVVQAMFPEYSRVHKQVFVRISDLPVIDRIRDLRREHLNALIRITGVVTRRTSVFPQLLAVKYDCRGCGFLNGPYMIQDKDEPGITQCCNCDGNGPFTMNIQETVFRNYQRITLQESPGKVPAGRVPRSKEVVLTHDLKDIVKPGEVIDVIGIYRHSLNNFLNAQHGFPVFSTMIEAVYISKMSEEGYGLSDEDIREIRSLSANPNIDQIIINSIAPSIHGHRNIKTAIAMAMFGGNAKIIPNSHRIRGDINILLMGDPGTAKSQFLKYVEYTADRAVFTTGKGASAVGLTASVQKDPLTREWTLEGGALVLADQGFCLIDEFDKMNDQDRTSIHEAMEQQSISISKAGIVATLQARCSVIAAANPIGGRYDSASTFNENVELTDPIISRFDVLCVVKDTIDPILDHQLALHVIKNHMDSHPGRIGSDDVDMEDKIVPIVETINQDLLRKYIRYARKHCSPRLNNIDTDKISSLYSTLRRESVRTGAVMMAVRHIESIMRLCEAHAKMHLRSIVNDDDVNAAIQVMVESFIGAQKFQVMKELRARFKKYLNYKKDSTELLFYILKQLIYEYARESNAVDVEDDVEREGFNVEVPISEFLDRVREYDIHSVDDFLESELLNRAGIQVDMERGMFCR